MAFEPFKKFHILTCRSNAVDLSTRKNLILILPGAWSLSLSHFPRASCFARRYWGVQGDPKLSWDPHNPNSVGIFRQKGGIICHSVPSSLLFFSTRGCHLVSTACSLSTELCSWRKSFLFSLSFTYLMYSGYMILRKIQGWVFVSATYL